MKRKPEKIGGSSRVKAAPEPPAPPPSAIRRWHLVMLAIILLAGGFVRFYEIGKLSFWMDELFSLAQSTGWYSDTAPLPYNQVIHPAPGITSLSDAKPWPRIWTVMHDGCHPPLYILILRPWRELFGQGEAAARSLSAIASIGAILLVFEIGRLLYATVAGLWAAALMAFAWPQLQFAQEARPYALLTLLGLAAMLAMVRIKTRAPTKWNLAGLAAAMLAMAMTHYFSIGALVALCLYASFALRGRARLLTLASMALAAAVFLALWGPALWNQRHAQYAFLIENDSDHVERSLWRFDELPQRFLTDLQFPRVALVGTALMLLPWPFLRRRRELVLPYLWFTCTVGLILVLDLVRSTTHLNWLRYTVLAAPGMYLVLAGALGRSRSALPHVLPLLLVIFCIAAIPDFHRRQKDDWRGLGAFVDARVDSDGPLIFALQTDLFEPLDWYVCLSHYAKPGRPIILLKGDPSPRIRQFLQSAGKAWLISDHVEISRLVPGTVVLREQQVKMTTSPTGEDPAWLVREVRFGSPDGRAPGAR